MSRSCLQDRVGLAVVARRSALNEGLVGGEAEPVDVAASVCAPTVESRGEWREWNLGRNGGMDGGDEMEGRAREKRCGAWWWRRRGSGGRPHCYVSWLWPSWRLWSWRSWRSWQEKKLANIVESVHHNVKFLEEGDAAGLLDVAVVGNDLAVGVEPNKEWGHNGMKSKYFPRA